MTYIAKLFFPDRLEILAANSFQALGSLVGGFLETHYQMSPIKVEFSAVQEA